MPKETKEERFKRIAEKRVQNILIFIQKLSQLSNTKVYSWSDEQLNKIWAVIENELKVCKNKFKNPDSHEFRL